MHKYTFLIPAYKSMFLDEMLRSIKNQRFSDFEVLVSDDNSPEDLFNIVAPYLDDSRFHYRRNETNLGGNNLVLHWNILIDLCETDYCIMAGDDDVYDDCFLERIDILVSVYPHVNLFRTRTCRINENGERFEEEQIYDEFEDQLKFFANYNERIHCIGNYVFKTDRLKAINKFVYFPLAWGSDSATALSCSKEGVVHTNEILFFFRRSSINISYANKKDVLMARQKIESTKLFFNWMVKYVDNIQSGKSQINDYLMTKGQIAYRDRIESQITTYYRLLGLKESYKLFIWMIHNGFLSETRRKVSYIVRWLI